MKNFKILALALFAIVALDCNQPPAPAPQDAAPMLEDSAVVEAVVRRPHPITPPVVASPDTRSLAQIAQAACTAADGSWRCASKKPVTFAAVGSTPIIPISWTVPAWFVDPQNTSTTASDNNDCVTSVTACRTWAEIRVHRMGFYGGCPSPYLRQNTVITFLSSHTDNTDPMSWCPNLENGAFTSIQGTTPTTTAAVFTLVTAKNRAAGANAILTGSFSAGAPAPGVVVQNTTAGKSSINIVHSTAGGANWHLTQPLAPTAVPTSVLAPAEVDTWASADTVNILTYVKVNVVNYQPTIIDQAVSNYAYLYRLRVFDPAGVGADAVFLNGAVQEQEVVFERGVTSITGQATLAGGTIGHDSAFINCYYLGGIWTTAFGDDEFIVGGGTNNFSAFVGEVGVDGDYVAGGFGLNFIAGGNFQLNYVFLDSNSTVSAGSDVAFVNGAYGGHVIYGTTGKNINFSQNSHGIMSGTYTAGWTQATLIATGVQLNGNSTGCSHTGAAPDVVNCGISTTVAHLDAAAGAAGFGGTAYNPGNASVSVLQ